ncbi:MAG TPA: amino acid racemase [Caldilineae bacterium]|jgi:aspartate racemase|nr:amino acid racemase [Caldilineae bacterium]
MKHIGIVACSAEGAALCYRTICIEGEKFIGTKYAHPEVTMHTFPFHEYMAYIEAGDWQRVADLMLASAEKLAAAGAEFAICPDNTIHQAFDLMVDKSPIPWLHIAEEIAAEAKRKGYQRLGILGTRYLMESPVYPEKLEARGITWAIPEPADRERINAIIFDELVYGRFLPESRAYFQQVIESLKREGCDAVVLGCTEIPLLIAEEDSPLPTLDSTRILARAALRRAV